MLGLIVTVRVSVIVSASVGVSVREEVVRVGLGPGHVSLRLGLGCRWTLTTY